MKSIGKALTQRLSIAISLLVVCVLLITDIAVDTWVENEFNRSIKDKVGLLETLVNEDLNGIEFEFSGEYLPEFEGSAEPEYFQLWYKGEVFERSDTLDLYSTTQLPYQPAALNTIVLEDLTLPDGRSGRIAHVSFIPQVDTDDRQRFLQQQGSQPRHPMELAYATSIEQLNYYLWFIDAAFILALIIVPLMIRFAVKNTVSYALGPLEALNREIRAVHFSGERKKITLKHPTEELTPIVDSLNHFINENYSLYLRERRLTSDIAHELKTPVTELINLAEVVIRFPGDKELEESFKPDVLKVGLRMKSIISSLMLIHKYSHQALACEDTINVTAMVRKLTTKFDPSRIQLIVEGQNCTQITSNAFALNSILVNLLSNALQYSPNQSVVTVVVDNQPGGVEIRVINPILQPISEQERSLMFDPLWQQDSSRTSHENFGLGLTIVKALVDAIGADIKVSSDGQDIQFTLLLSPVV